MFYGVLPVLEVNGKQLGQSFAIYRYLAGKYGKQAASADHVNLLFPEVTPYLP